MTDIGELTALPGEHKAQLARDALDSLGITVKRQIRDELIIPCPVSSYHSDQDRNPTAALNTAKMLFHCLAGETLIKTDQGEVPIRELAGGVHRILDGGGKWVEAPIKEYGQDRLYKITLSRNGVRKEVYATAGHRWYVSPAGRSAKKDLVVKTTTELKPRMRIPSVWPHQRTGRTEISPLGVMRGFVYGDGTATTHNAVAQFCGEKDKALLPYFSQLKNYTYGDVIKIPTGIPRSWKLRLPDLDEGPSFLLGWLAGYFAADGCVADDGHISISSARLEALEHVIAICDRLGIGTYTLSTRSRTGFSTTSDIHTLTLRGKGITPDFFLIPEHRRRFQESQATRKYERTHWWVSSVEETDRFETVYCAEVPTTQSFVLEGNILTGNCLGCDASGTILWLIATVRGDTTIDQAREWLLGEAGLTQAVGLPDMLAFFDALYTPKTRPPMPVYSDRMLERWQGIDGYLLDDRQIPIDTAIRMRLCTDPDGYVDRKRTGPRAVIPHWWKGKLVGWQSRRLPCADPSAPKYLSTPAFPRDETIYGDNPSGDTLVVAESPMSVLRHLHHQPMAATFGFVVTDLQIQHLVRGRRRLIWFMDNDLAGWQATHGRTHNGRFFPGAPQRASAYCDNWVVENPFDADPADMSDEMVDILVNEHAVPWQVWQRPQTLYCHRCFQPSHPGRCAV